MLFDQTLNKYEVGINDGEFLGIYYAQSAEDAIKMCRSEMIQANIRTDENGIRYSMHFRAGNFIASLCEY